MSWLRLDDGFAQHPKIARLPRGDRWTWLEVLLYCARYKTAGVVPASIGEVLPKATRSFLGRCSDLGLLDSGEGGYVVHDWAIYNAETLGEKVHAYLETHPGASANEVHKAIGGKRELVLSLVAQVAAVTGTQVVPDQYPNGTSRGSRSGSHAGT